MQKPETTQMRHHKNTSSIKYVAAGCEPRTAKQFVFSSL